MISLTIIADNTAANAFLVRIQGELKNPRGLNAALGSRLADELQDHFRLRNKEPNRLGGAKTNFWQDVAEATLVSSVTDTEAIVSVAETRFRIHLFGGTIKPTGGRKFLTIPLIKEARATENFTGRVEDYEKKYGRKLFRLPNTGVLVERSDQGGERFASKATTGVIRGKQGFRKISIGAGSKLRVVYALKTSVTLKKDPRALPPSNELAAALQAAGEDWIKRNLAATP